MYLRRFTALAASFAVLGAPGGMGNTEETHLFSSEIIELYNDKSPTPFHLPRTLCQEATSMAFDHGKVQETLITQAQRRAAHELRILLTQMPIDPTCLDGKKCPLGMCCLKDGMCSMDASTCAESCVTQCDTFSEAKVAETHLCPSGDLVPRQLREGQMRLNDLMALHKRLHKRASKKLEKIQPSIKQLMKEVHMLEMLIRTGIGLSEEEAKAEGERRVISNAAGLLSKDDLDDIAFKVQSNVEKKAGNFRRVLELASGQTGPNATAP